MNGLLASAKCRPSREPVLSTVHEVSSVSQTSAIEFLFVIDFFWDYVMNVRVSCLEVLTERMNEGVEEK